MGSGTRAGVLKKKGRLALRGAHAGGPEKGTQGIAGLRSVPVMQRLCTGTWRGLRLSGAAAGRAVPVLRPAGLPRGMLGA